MPFSLLSNTPGANRRTVWTNQNLWSSAQPHGLTPILASKQYRNGLPILREEYENPKAPVPQTYNPITKSPPKQRGKRPPVGTPSPIVMRWFCAARTANDRISMHQLAADVAHANNCDQVCFDNAVPGTTTGAGAQVQIVDHFGPHFTARFHQANGNHWARAHVYTDSAWDTSNGNVSGDIQGPSKRDAIANPTFTYLGPQHPNQLQTPDIYDWY